VSLYCLRNTTAAIYVGQQGIFNMRHDNIVLAFAHRVTVVFFWIRFGPVLFYSTQCSVLLPLPLPLRCYPTPLPADIIISRVVVALINSQSVAVSLSLFRNPNPNTDPDPDPQDSTAASSSLASLSFMQKRAKDKTQIE